MGVGCRDLLARFTSSVTEGYIIVFYTLWHHKGTGSGGTLYSHSVTAASLQNGHSG